MSNTLFQLDSEIAILSTILKSPDNIYKANNLRFFMFSSNPHQALYGEFEEMIEKGLSPDVTLVIASLESKNILDKVGGKKYLDLLMSKDFPESSFQEFVKMVMDSYKARNFLSIVSSVNRANISTSTVEESIYETKKALETLLEVGGNPQTIHVSDVARGAFEEIVARTKNPGIRGVSWGVPELDRATGGKSGGDMWVIGGRPGAGKTALVCNSVYQDGLNGVPALILEREMTTQQLLERLISIDTGIPNTNIRLGVLSQDQIDMVYKSLGKIKTFPIFLDTNFHGSDPYYLESTINKFKNKHGIKVVYLDYIQILADRDENQTQDIGRLSRMFKLLSNELDICSVLLSQLNRNVESREDKRPMLSDFKQSGALEEDTDYAVGLYRDEYYNKETKYKNLMEFIILKNRNGPPGTITLGFDGPSNRIGQA